MAPDAPSEERSALRPSDDTALPRFTAFSLLLLRSFSAFFFLLFSIILTYTCATDGSPFRSSLLTPWMSTTLVDFYLVLLPLLLLVCLRHRRSPRRL